MAEKLTAFVDTIREQEFLSGNALQSLMQWAAAPDADPQTIAKQVVERGWLTPFQVKAIWKGRIQELILGQYILVEKIGEGGMGEVFKAKHRRMDRIVALKLIRKQRLAHPDAVKRFRREIQVAAQLAHENIVMAYDADQAGDVHFFAMEYVDGSNLSRMVRENGPLPVSEACSYIRQTAQGLQHGHERGMIHRDIKPSNLLVTRNGVVKILDLGLARLSETPDGSDPSRITHDGLVIGTPDFIAPEQARNAHTADIRSDIYSLGCTFYYLVTGQMPFPGGTPTEKMLRHTTDLIPEVHREDFPPSLATILRRMTAKKASDRYQTPEELIEMLPMGTPRITPRPSAPSGANSGTRISVPTGLNAAPVTAPATSSPRPNLPGAPIPSPLPNFTPTPEEPKSENLFRLPTLPDIEHEHPSQNHFWIALMVAGMALALIVLAALWIIQRKGS